MWIEGGNPSTDHLQGSCYETLDTVSGCFHWNVCFCNKITTSAGERRWTILNLRFKVFWVRNMGTKHYISYSSLKALLFICNIFAVALFKDPMNNSNIMLKSEHRAFSSPVTERHLSCNVISFLLLNLTLCLCFGCFTWTPSRPSMLKRETLYRRIWQR